VSLPTLDRQFDPGLIAHMFPQGRMLPQLRLVDLDEGRVSEPDVLTCVARACPALEGMFFNDPKLIIYPEQQLPALQSLQQLQQLSLSVLCVEDNGPGYGPTLKALAVLTQLQFLFVSVVHKVHAQHLLLLTGLKKLEALRWGSEHYFDTYRVIALHNTVSRLVLHRQPCNHCCPHVNSFLAGTLFAHEKQC
jgi:hypothetical protein